jgi:hypothetical protein
LYRRSTSNAPYRSPRRPARGCNRSTDASANNGSYGATNYRSANCTYGSAFSLALSGAAGEASGGDGDKQ